MRRARLWAARIGLLLLASLLGGELVLQLAAWLRPDRSAAFSEGAARRVLCVGDSHTWGAGVGRDESYPSQLQAILDERQPHRYGVVNLGQPGMNTSQLRNRLPSWLERYEPDYLVVWVGVNNAWNSAEMSFEGEGLLARLDRMALRSRLYRLVRTRLHDRSLEQAAEPVALLGGGQADLSERDDPLLASVAPEKREQLLRRAPQMRSPRPEDRWQHRMEKELGPLANGEDRSAHRDSWDRVADDLAAIAGITSAMGVRLLVIDYPLELGHYRSANRAIDATAERLSLDLVPSRELLQRVPPEERDWRWALHPGPRLYREIARELADRIAGPAAP